MSRLWDINACLFLLPFSKDRCHHIAIDGKERCFRCQQFLSLDRDYPPPLPIPLIFSSFSCSWRRKTLLQNYPVAKKCTVHERKIERDSRLINPQQLFHTCFIFIDEKSWFNQTKLRFLSVLWQTYPTFLPTNERWRLYLLWEKSFNIPYWLRSLSANARQNTWKSFLNPRQELAWFGWINKFWREVGVSLIIRKTTSFYQI